MNGNRLLPQHRVEEREGKEIRISDRTRDILVVKIAEKLGIEMAYSEVIERDLIGTPRSFYELSTDLIT